MRNQQPRNLLTAMVLAGLIGCAGETSAPTDQVTITAQVSLALSINNPATVTVSQNTTNNHTTFVVTNVGTVSGTANVACSSTFNVTCVEVEPSSFVIAPGASRNVSVTWDAGAANFKNTLSLTDASTGAKGTQVIRITS